MNHFRKPLLLSLFVLGVLPFTLFGQDCKDDSVFEVHNENVQKTKQQATDFVPGARKYYVQDFNDNQNIYLKAALSAKKREDWLGDWKDPNFVKCMNVVLDELAVIARKTLPGYRPVGYTLNTPAEDKLLRGAITDIANAVVFRSGVESADWRIDKNGLGIPNSRFKYGMVYLKYPKSDDGFCRIVWVNIVQDYAGGGTYGASHGTFIKSEMAGCPANN